MRTIVRKIFHWEAGKLAFFLSILIGSALVFTLTPSLFPSALISTLLFFIFSPTIDAVERKGMSRTSGILAVFLLGGLVIAFCAVKITPLISEELDSVQQGSAAHSIGIAARLKAQETKLLGGYPLFKDTRLTEKAIAWVQRSADRFWNFIPNVASQMMLCLLLVPFLTFILLKDAHEIRRSLLRLVPNRYFETVYSLTSRILDEMGGYVAARILEAVLVSILVTVGCVALKIQYAILLGVFAGATNAIPYLGPLLGALPGVALAVLEPSAPNQLLFTMLVYLVANLIDIMVIFPLVVAKIVDLHPVAVVVAVVLGSQLFGIVGMIMAVPITSILKILIQEVYSRVYKHSEFLYK